MNTALKKKSLEESLNGHTGGTIESERLVEVVGENELRDILDQYKEFLDKNLIFNYQGSAFDAEDVSYAFDLVKRTLTPEEINNFLQLTAICDDHPLYWSNTSLFLSGLIQESYNDGNSSFDLNVQNFNSLWAIGAFLDGSQEQPLSIKVNGNIDSYLGVSSKDVKFYLNGNTTLFCGSCSQNSEFYIEGDASGVGFGSRDSLFDLRGKVKDIYLANAKGSTFLISDRDLFERTREKYAGVVRAEALERNEIYFVHPDGHKELLVIEK